MMFIGSETSVATRLTARALAFVLFASVLSVVPFVSTASAQTDFVPWECNGTPILMRGGIFHEILPDPANPGELIIEEIPGTSGIANSTAHDPLTNWVYGVARSGDQSVVRAYDATGAVVFNTVIQAPFPDRTGGFSGTVLGDGRYIIHSVGGANATLQSGWFDGNRRNLWSVDPVTGAATHLGVDPGIADIAYNPADGFVYHVINRVLYQIDPNNGAITTTPTSTDLAAGGFGASWFDSSGNLFLFDNDPGDIWRVNVNDPGDVELVGSPGSDGGTDGTNCVSSIDLTKDVVDAAGDSVAPADRIYGPGDTVTYEFTLINNGVPTQNRTVDLCDVLPIDGRTYTGVWSSTDPDAVLTSGGQAGDTAFCIEADMPSSLFTDPANPGSDPTVITIDVVLGDDVIPGVLENQATLDFDQDGTVDVLSDDIGDSTDPRDPTTIQVLGGFEVSKTVEGHPEDNDTDSFPVTIVCVAADGTPHTVDAASIVDAATGAPWPGATTNGFTFSNGDDVRIEDIPAGTTCTTTEGTNPGYTTTVDVTDDGGEASSSGELTVDAPIDDEQIDFTNSTGTIGIRKRATADGVASDGTFTFDIECSNGFTETISLTTTNGSASITYPDTPLIGAGVTCTVSENVPAGWVLTSSNDVEIEIATGTLAGAGFENERQLSDLTIEKEITGLPDDIDPASLTFEVTVECRGGLDPDPFITTGTFGVGSPLVVEDLPVGAVCEVTETPVDGFTTRYSPSQEVDITIDDAEVVVTNSTGSLIIEKITQVSDTHPIDPTGEFEFTLECVSPDGSTLSETFVVDASELIPGGATGGIGHDEIGVLAPGTTCTVTENLGAGTDDGGGDDGGGDDGTGDGATSSGTAAGGNLVTDFCQDDSRFEIQIRNATPFPFSDLDWEMIWRDRPYATITGLSPGPYTHSVFLNPNGLYDHVFTSTTPLLANTNLLIFGDRPDPGGNDNCSDIERFILDGGTTGLAIDPNSTARSPFAIGSASLSAASTGTPAGGDLVTDFCQDNSRFEIQIRNTTPGPLDWEMIWRDRPYATIPGLTPGPYTYAVVPTAGGLFDHVFTSTTPLSGNDNLLIFGDRPDPDGNNNCSDIERFIGGSGVVTDPGAGGTAGDEWTNAGDDTVTLEITADDPEPTATFTNVRNVGSLTINKTIDGVPADLDLGDEPFTIDVSCSGEFTVDPYLISGSTVTANTPLVIDDLPTGTECTVTEQADPRFTTTGSPETVTISEDGQTVEITNTTSTFTLDKTTVASSLSDDANGTFDFSIVCTFDGVEVANTPVSITTTDNAGAALASALPLVPPGSECVVTETVPAGWTVSGRTGGSPLGASAIEFTTATGGTAIAFENTLDSATLTIVKDVTGIVADSDLEAETFTVTVTCTGNFPGGSFNSGPLTIVEGTPIDIDDLPVGAVCTVTETPDPRFGTTYVPGDTLTIVDGTNEVLIENETSTFTISKTTDVPAGVNPDDTFDFAVECVDPSGAVLFSGTATITTTDGEGEWAEAPLLPPGTECTVTEQTPPTGWSIEGPNPVNITIDADSIVDAVFENTRDTADLEITKTVIGAPAGLDVTALVFTVDISCVGDFTTSPLVLSDQPIADGDTITVSDLPTGAVCTVIEDADPQFAASSTPVEAATVGVTITDAGAEVAIINATGEIMIVKNTEVDSALPIDLTESFDFFVDCGAAYSGTHTIAADTVTSPTTATGFLRYSDLPALPNGTACTVTEQTAPAGWTLTSANPVDLTVDSAGVATATFTNERDTGELTITKEIEGLPAGTILDAELFDVTVTCTGGFTTPTHVVTGQISVDAPLVISDLPAGTECSAVETPDPRFSTTTGADVVVSTTGEEIQIVNTTSTLSITKTTDGPGIEPLDLDDTFTFEVECVSPTGTVLFAGTQTITTSSQTGTWATPDTPLLPPGTECTVTENPTVGWTALTPSPIVLVTDSAGIVDAAFENERNAGELTINKVLDGVPAGTDLDAELFDVTVTCTGGFATDPFVTTGQFSVDTPFVVTDLPTGTSCAAVETPDPRFATTSGADAIITSAGNAIEIVNTTSTLSITKTTTGPAGASLVLDDTFTFDVECVNPAGTVLFAATQTITTSSQTGTWATPDTPLLPPGTECTVTELAPPTGWTITSPPVVTITTDSAGVVDAAFENTRDTADLNITKTVIGAPLGLDLDVVEFTVDISCVGDFTTSPLVFADQPIFDGGDITIPDLPTGAVCTVIEDRDPRFATTTAPVDVETAGIAITDAGADVAIVNATGEIMIVKNTQVASGLPVDITESFDFAVDCGAAYSGTHTVDVDTATSATTATGSLGYSDLPVLPEGTSCIVTELAAPAGWTLTSANDIPLTVDSAGVAVAEFTNVRDTGDLTITKTLDGVPVGTDLDAFLFDLTITCTGGFSTADHTVTGQFSVDTPFVLSDIPTGAECSAVETPDPRFATSTGADVVLDVDGEEIEIVNTTSTLSITKTTTGPSSQPLDLDDDFSFSVVCSTADGTELFSGTQTITTAGQIGTWAAPATPLLPPGTECEVSENPAIGWTLSTPNPVTITTESTAVADAAFTNERDTGPLTITKALDGVPAGTDLDAELFDVTVTCSNGFTTTNHVVAGQFSVDAPLVIPDLPTGAVCSAVETPDPRFSTTTSGGATISQRGERIGITNTTSTLSITKTTVGPDTHDLDLDETFDFDVVCSTADGTELFSGTQTVTTVGQTGAWATPATPLLPPGTECSVTEQTPPTGWTNISGPVVEVVTGSAAIIDAAFVNERDTAELAISKSVIGAPAGLDVAGLVFTVDISCVGDFASSPLVLADQPIGDGGTINIADLPTGSTCTVIEDADPRFATTTAPIDVETAGTVITDAGADVAIVNATGEIMIVKNTQVASGLPVDVTESFDFAVDCGAAYAGTHTVDADTVTSPTTATGFLRYSDLPALPNGTDCTVTELAAPAGWTLTSDNDIALTVDSAGVAVAEFTNERDTGDLTITKTLDGVPVGTDLDAFLFDLTITCSGGFTTTDHVETGQFSVDAPFVLENIPTGASCAAEETPDARFATTTSSDVVVETTGNGIEIVNTTSTLSITKTTTGPDGQPLDLDDTFSFEVLCSAADGAVLFSGTQSITTTGQIGTWETPTTPLLPPGTECEISENALAGWAPLTPSPVVISTDSGVIVDAAFANERQTGQLTISKILEGVPEGTDLDAELFDVTVTCSNGFATTTNVVDGQISVDTPLVISDLPTNATCSVAETPDARFATTEGPAVSVTADGTTIDIINTTSTLSITKTTVGPDTHPLDLDATFDFGVECVNPAGTVLFSGTPTITTLDQTGTWATPATPLLPPGTVCSVAEQTPPAGWTNISGENVDVTTESATIVDAAFTNERDTAELSITKTVLGAPDGVDLSETFFDVTVTCSNGFATETHVVTGQVSSISPFVIPDLPTDATCEVVEASDARFNTTYAPDNGLGTGAVALIVDGGSVAQITNSTGAIIVTKETIVPAAHPIDPVGEFTFTIDCGAVYTADHTITTDALTATGALGVIFYTDLPLLPDGTVCDVTELDETPQWTLTTDRTVTLTATSTNPVTAEFVNEATIGSVAINKIVEGPEEFDLSAEPFEITVTCSGNFTENPYVLNGTISEIAPWTIEELPFGADCAAEETPDPRFTTSYSSTDSPDTGAVTITTEPSAVSVINQTGSLHVDIETLVSSARPFDPDGDFTFNITCSNGDEVIYEAIVQAATEDGLFNWEAILFPTGSTCETSLDDTIEWNLSASMGEATTDNVISQTIGTDIAWNSFEVERALASLDVTKQLENIPFDGDFSTEVFPLSVTCSGGFIDDSHTLTGVLGVSSVSPLIVEDLPVGSECTISEEANEFFDATYSPDATFTIDEIANNEILITNSGTEILEDFLRPEEPELPILAFTGRTTRAVVWFALLLMAAGIFLAGPRRHRKGEI